METNDIKEIPIAPGYYLNRDGKIFSTRTKYGKKPMTELKPSKDKDGYLRVNIMVNKKPLYISIHRLMLLTFVREHPVGTECGHLNGVPNDNRIENLKWITRKENAAHRLIHGTQSQGEKHWYSKLNRETVIKIRNEFLSYGRTSNMAELARKYDLSHSTVSRIIKRTSWKHI